MKVYAVIAFYLRHTDQVGAYLAQRRQEADCLRSEIQPKYGRQGIRERLLARHRDARPE
jgi:hypothetical protein